MGGRGAPWSRSDLEWKFETDLGQKSRKLNELYGGVQYNGVVQLNNAVQQLSAINGKKNVLHSGVDVQVLGICRCKFFWLKSC
mmetsp:Transcript_5346/g.9498  ORF Transcript_5346/g.9498 Transcript_5346/m.9498 type:complete len:83 (-) Transcript_5346:3039-3287(-)